MGGVWVLFAPKCISDVSESLHTIKNQHMLTKDILIDKTSTSGDRLALTHPYIAGFHPQEILLKGKAHQQELMEDLSAEEDPSTFYRRHEISL